jgi:hypothetical protein
LDDELIEEVTLSDDKFNDGDLPAEIIVKNPEFRKPSGRSFLHCVMVISGKPLLISTRFI